MKYWISLGSNMGDRLIALANARAWLGDSMGPLVRESSIYETAPWGMESVTSFYNQVVVVSTGIQPEAVIEMLLEYEESKGRTRADGGYQDRLIDLDILYIDDMILTSDSLMVPHPKIQDRRFILEPLCEISEDTIHPVLKKTHTELLKTCGDSLSVNKIS